MEETNEGRIGRYLSGEMTGFERIGFEEEILQNPGLSALLNEYQRIWDLSSQTPSMDWDTDQAWSRFQQSKLQITEIPSPRSNRFLYWAAAAVVVLLAGVYTLFFREGSPVTYAYQEGITEPIVLKDGSRILLNKASTLTVYPFTSRKRHVELTGEAYFEVGHDPKRPFTISCGGTLTEVVGTAFNIRSTPDQTRIFVQNGKIIFSSENNPQEAVALTEGEAAVYRAHKMQMIANPSPNVIAWRTHQLRFVKMPLSAIAEDVSAYFDRKVIIENESSKECLINIPLAFKKPEINAVLEAVATTISAEVVVEGDSYIIRGGRSCD